MKPPKSILLLSWLVFFPGNASADPSEQELSFTAGSGTTWNVDWTGIAGRTYFIQWSLDLENWSYAPTLDFGIDTDSYGIDTNAEEKFFVRLKYIDADWISTLQEARDADFDADGIPNYFEVENLFSDPFDRESNGGDTDNGGAGDGLSDGWEMFYFGNLNTAFPTDIGQPDGLTNKEKSDLGLNPNTYYSDPNASAPSKFTYDLTGRLTGVTAPVGTATYTPDEEGNLDSN